MKPGCLAVLFRNLSASAAYPLQNSLIINHTLAISDFHLRISQMWRAGCSTKASLSCGLLVIACVSASAADLATAPRYSPIPIDSWTGFYVGLGGGFSSLNNKIDALPGSDPSSPLSASLNGLGADGLLATISAGYDYQLSPAFVAGIFGDFDFHSLKSSLDINIPSAPLSGRGEFSVNHQWSVGGRLGFLTSPGTLVFLTGGFTELSVSDFTANISGGSQTLALDATVPTIAGGFVGAGFETKLTSSISLKGEYRFTDFGSGAVTLPNINGTDLNQFATARVTPTLQIVKASVNYRF
jgi:outer membrane immunogenic protein